VDVGGGKHGLPAAGGIGLIQPALQAALAVSEALAVPLALVYLRGHLKFLRVVVGFSTMLIKKPAKTLGNFKFFKNYGSTMPGTSLG
jgi:hypothetical protein